MIIAIDGPAASGKGTLARKLAAHLGFHYLDTGSLYRAVAWKLLDDGQAASDAKAAEKAALSLDMSTIRDRDLRNDEVGQAASIVAAMAPVRQAVLDFQRRFAGQVPGSVVDGRDIGTVVCPHADVKIFVVADAKTRANRRFLELKAAGHEVTEAAVLRDIQARDARDQERDLSPLKPAQDAHLLDTTELSI
jgi:cytidylate kinase